MRFDVLAACMISVEIVLSTAPLSLSQWLLVCFASDGNHSWRLVQTRCKACMLSGKQSGTQKGPEHVANPTRILKMLGIESM